VYIGVSVVSVMRVICLVQLLFLIKSKIKYKGKAIICKSFHFVIFSSFIPYPPQPLLPKHFKAIDSTFCHQVAKILQFIKNSYLLFKPLNLDACCSLKCTISMSMLGKENTVYKFYF
jgi:hypothetical protein